MADNLSQTSARQPLNWPDHDTFVAEAKALNSVSPLTFQGPIQFPGGKAPEDINLPSDLQPIDGGLDTNPDFSFSTLAASASRFRFWQVETLLNQAAGLLERGMRERAEYDDLRAKWCALRLDILEFEKLNELHEREIADGYYVVTSKQSDAEVNAGETTVASGTSVAGQLASVLNGNGPLSGPTQDETAELASKAVWASLQLPDPNKLHDLPKAVDLLDAARQFNKESTLTGLQAQAGIQEAARLSAQGSADIATARQDGLQAKADWDTVNMQYLRNRSEVAIYMNTMKKLFMRAGGPYNYIEQAGRVQQRFMRDFRDAYARLCIAQQGLEQLYGYNTSGAVPQNLGFDPVKFVPETEPALDNDVSFFNQCLLWTSDAIRYLVAFGQLDQNYVLPISVRTHLVQGAWDTILTQAQNQATAPITFLFEVPAALFTNQYHVRLRGISAFVVESSEHPGDPGDTWQMTLRPPKKSYCTLLPSLVPAGQTGVVPLDQSDVPFVPLRRVMSRSSVRDPDIQGIASLHNISPFGSMDPAVQLTDRVWALTVEGTSLLGNSAANLRDVQIDLLIAMRSSV